jgi:two-component system, sensor histidine kinase PdtaS
MSSSSNRRKGGRGSGAGAGRGGAQPAGKGAKGGGAKGGGRPEAGGGEADQAIVSDWQILADLSFSDLLMFCRDPEVTNQLVVVAQMRPYTAQTIYQEDLVGRRAPARERPASPGLRGEVASSATAIPDWSTGVPVREEAIPVSFDGEVIAVVTREANLSMVRAPSQLELTYLQAADELSQMLARGVPVPRRGPRARAGPRVGDGMMRMDATGW